MDRRGIEELAGDARPSGSAKRRVAGPACTPARFASRRLVSAVSALSGYRRGDPDCTLGELRLAMLGTGFTWSEDGRLVYSTDRIVLVNELDELIAAFGGGTKAADLFS